MTIKSLWHNDTAKVPLAVIGVFLLLISVMLSINYAGMYALKQLGGNPGHHP